MIRDVMVWLDGGISDEVRLAAVADITRRLQSNVVIGLFLNPLPLPGPVSGDATAELVTVRGRLATKSSGYWPSDSSCSRGRSSFGGSMCWPTTSPISLP